MRMSSGWVPHGGLPEARCKVNFPIVENPIIRYVSYKETIFTLMHSIDMHERAVTNQANGRYG
jgi:hypothetical protein